FPKLNMLSYWFMWPAFILILVSFFAEGGGPGAGWTSYPTLASAPMPAGQGLQSPAAPNSGHGQIYWLLALIFVGISSMMGSINYLTTIMILPAMGMVSDIISTFARRPLFGYRAMIYSIAGIAGLGFIVWGHHMFQSGMDPRLGTGFMIATIMIALPSAVKVFNWLGTTW